MDDWLTWVAAVAFAAGLGALAIFARNRRLRTLQVSEYDADRHDQLRSLLVEYVGRHSYALGTWVDLPPFWKKEGVKLEGDRLKILAPLLEEVVLLVPVPQGEIDKISHRVIDWFSLALPDRVMLPEIVFRRMYQGESITVGRIEIKGDWVAGSQDKSVNFGPRAGRDMAGGDIAGRDQAAGDARSINTEGEVVGSGNVGDAWGADLRIASRSDLHRALRELGQEAQSRGESESVTRALKWAAEASISEGEPDRVEQSRNQRALDRGSEWLRAAMSAIASGVTGALTGHWLVEILRG